MVVALLRPQNFNVCRDESNRHRYPQATHLDSRRPATYLDHPFRARRKNSQLQLVNQSPTACNSSLLRKIMNRTGERFASRSLSDCRQTAIFRAARWGWLPLGRQTRTFGISSS